MKALRHFGFLLCLAFAFAIGQQGAVLHALSHATDQVQHKGDSKPAKLACDQCALSGQPSGMPGAGMPVVAQADGAVAEAPLVAHEAPYRAVIVFLSRAPPVLS
jgi:hypothetical protein